MEGSHIPFVPMRPLVHNVLAGMIILWGGAVVDIPLGFALCDGNNGTPDLRDRFIVGAGSTYAPDATGGVTFHSHVVPMTAHKHDIVAGAAISAGANYAIKTQVGDASETSLVTDGRPPYYALAYVMKL